MVSLFIELFILGKTLLWGSLGPVMALFVLCKELGLHVRLHLAGAGLEARRASWLGFPAETQCPTSELCLSLCPRFLGGVAVIQHVSHLLINF